MPPNSTDRATIRAANVVGYTKEAAEYDCHAIHDVAFEVARAQQPLRATDFPQEALCAPEIGGGTGEGTAVAREAMPDAFHVISDMSLAMLHACRRKFADTPLVVCDAEHLPFTAEAFHAVVCASFLHHLPDDGPVCEAVAGVLEPWGLFLGIREPNVAGADRAYPRKHLVRRYGDREGLKTLFRRLLGRPQRMARSLLA